MINYEEALQTIKQLTKSFGKETVALDDADCRVLAEDVKADRDYPPFNRAAMDGFAIRQSDWENGIRKYKLQEVIYAGQEYEEELVSGTCYKIMTGAAVPPSADMIIRREDAQEKENIVTLHADNIKPFQNIARQGEDVQQEQIIVLKQTLINPSVISSLAAVGKANLLVERLPEVALFTTGDEIMPVGVPVSAIQIRNSNQQLLKSLLRKWKIKPSLCKHIPDEKAQLKATLQEALYHDMIIMSGGVSAGDADYVPQVLEELGVVKHFHKVAIKPGKPIFFGQLPNGGVIFALPGNPFSCLVTFTLFIEAYFYNCFGLKDQPVYTLPLQQQRSKKHKLLEFFAVRLDRTSVGVMPLTFNGSGDIRAGLTAHGLAIHPSDQESLAEGENVEFIPFSNSFV